MPLLPTPHRRRLREIWRSAGWPCRDPIEVDLLAAGLLERQLDGGGRETLRLTDSGVAMLAATLERNRAAFGAHETLVARVAREMQRSGRIVWRGLNLRAPLAAADGATRWVVAMPDVFSIRHTTVEDFAEPVVHEIKVRRADLLSDLRRPDKGSAYRALSSQCWYVLQRGIAEADEIPADYGVMFADATSLEVARPAPRRAARVPFAVWMALARANAEPQGDDDHQGLLGAALRAADGGAFEVWATDHDEPHADDASSVGGIGAGAQATAAASRPNLNADPASPAGQAAGWSGGGPIDA